MKRRDFLKLSAAAVASGAVSRRASAQAANWPTRPVKLIIPYAPGGASDIIGRPWADVLSQSFGQQFVIENRGGAAGMIGVEAASKAAPDGYTFLLTPSAAMSVLPLLRQTPYDPKKNFVPVARIGDSVSGFVMHPSTGLKTMKDTVEYAKKNPGKLVYGSSGLGSIQHMRIEMLKYRAGIDILHVPYRGAGDALNDLLAGQIQMMNEINVLPHAKAGKLNLLCMNSPDRSPEFPDTPTLTECGLSEFGPAELVRAVGAGRRAGRHRRQAAHAGGRDHEDARRCSRSCGRSAGRRGFRPASRWRNS